MILKNIESLSFYIPKKYHLSRPWISFKMIISVKNFVLRSRNIWLSIENKHENLIFIIVQVYSCSLLLFYPWWFHSKFYRFHRVLRWLDILYIFFIRFISFLLFKEHKKTRKSLNWKVSWIKKREGNPRQWIKKIYIVL